MCVTAKTHLLLGNILQITSKHMAAVVFVRVHCRFTSDDFFTVLQVSTSNLHFDSAAAAAVLAAVLTSFSLSAFRLQI